MSLMMCSYSEKRIASFVEKFPVKMLFKRKKKKKAVLITKLEKILLESQNLILNQVIYKK